MLRFAESWSLSLGDSGKSERMVKEVFLSKSRCNIFLCLDLKLGAETKLPSSLAGGIGPVDMTSESSPRKVGLSRRYSDIQQLQSLHPFQCPAEPGWRSIPVG